MALITLSDVLKHFKEDMKTFKRGEGYFKVGHALKFALENFEIIAHVQASFKDKTYEVKVNIASGGGIEDVQCTCPRGKYPCSHEAAVLVHAAVKGISKTDVPM